MERSRKRRYASRDSAADHEVAVVPSVVEFSELLTSLSASEQLASTSDVYTVYCALLKEGYSIAVRSESVRFHTLSISKEEKFGTVHKTVVPISCQCPDLTVQVLKELSEITERVVLAWVSQDGDFAMHQIMGRIVAPEEKLKT